MDYNAIYKEQRSIGDILLAKSIQVLKLMFHTSNVIEADFKADVKYETDVFVTMANKKYRIAVRNRLTTKYMDFTIRKKVRNNTQTECDKFYNADYYFYTWSNLPDNPPKVDINNARLDNIVLVDVKKMQKDNSIKKWKWHNVTNPNNQNNVSFFTIPLNYLNYIGAIIKYKLQDENILKDYDPSLLDSWGWE